jgi:hypothetical protein
MFSWLSKWWDSPERLRKQRGNHLLHVPEQGLAGHTLLSLRLLERSLVHGLDRQLMGVLAFDATHPNVQMLTEYLQSILEPLSVVEPLGPDHVVSVTHEKVLRDFFVDLDSHYIPAEVAVKEMIPHAMALCDMLIAWEGAEPGAEKHNVRVLQKVLLSLSSLSKALLRCCQLG